MNTETTDYKGYTIKIENDDSPENPFEAWDCEPPLLTFYGGRHSYAKTYQDAPENMYEVVKLCAQACPALFGKDRVKTIRENLNCTLHEFAEYMRENGGDFKAAFTDAADNQVRREGWGAACEWFEFAESLLKQAGIPCMYSQSNGYCQGDCTLCLVILTPDFFTKSGCKPEHATEIMQGTLDLYSAWAWGDVYGVSEIIAPGPLDEDGDETEGEELAHGSCWGYYGRDHEKSGIMEHARAVIDCHREERAKEEQAILSAVSAE